MSKIIGSRQAFIDCSNVPPIDRFEKDFKFDIKHQEIIKRMSGSLSGKYCIYKNPNYDHEKETNKKQRQIFKDCIEQTIIFLHNIKALKPVTFKVRQITLWQKAFNLEPFYEGINVSLNSMLIKHHFPSMYAQIMKGEIYSHVGLSDVKEGILYTMEYLKKMELLKDVDTVIKNKEVKEWVDTQYKKSK